VNKRSTYFVSAVDVMSLIQQLGRHLCMQPSVAAMCADCNLLYQYWFVIYLDLRFGDSLLAVHCTPSVASIHVLQSISCSKSQQQVHVNGLFVCVNGLCNAIRYSDSCAQCPAHCCHCMLWSDSATSEHYWRRVPSQLVSIERAIARGYTLCL